MMFLLYLLMAPAFLGHFLLLTFCLTPHLSSPMILRNPSFLCLIHLVFYLKRNETLTAICCYNFSIHLFLSVFNDDFCFCYFVFTIRYVWDCSTISITGYALAITSPPTGGGGLFTYAQYQLTALSTCQWHPWITSTSDSHMAYTSGCTHYPLDLLDYSQPLSHDTTFRHIGNITPYNGVWCNHHCDVLSKDLRTLLSVRASGLACTYKKTRDSL